MKALLYIFFSSLLLIPTAYSADLLSCEWGGSPSNDERLFYAHDEFSDITGASEGDVLSSPISFSQTSGFTNPLSCTSPLNRPDDSLRFYASNDEQCSGNESLLHFTDDTNGLAALEYDSSEHSKTLCAELPTTISSVDLVISEDDRYEDIGYTCLFRTSGNESGRISSCDAEFNSGDKYRYTIWARAFQSDSSLSCTSDCTSEIDNRVRTACSQKVAACEGIPDACDGSLLDSWVHYNETHQIQCSNPWDQFREDPTSDDVGFEVESEETSCPNLISQDYSVILDDEAAVMKVFVCSD